MFSWQDRVWRPDKLLLVKDLVMRDLLSLFSHVVCRWERLQHCRYKAGGHVVWTVQRSEDSECHVVWRLHKRAGCVPDVGPILSNEPLPTLHGMRKMYGYGSARPFSSDWILCCGKLWLHKELSLLLPAFSSWSVTTFSFSLSLSLSLTLPLSFFCSDTPIVFSAPTFSLCE